MTPRELQIIELVAQGLTNAEIGAKLWIQENSVKQALKRIFRNVLSVKSCGNGGEIKECFEIIKVNVNPEAIAFRV